MSDSIDRQAAIRLVHGVLYEMMVESAATNIEQPMSEQDKLLLKVNKAVCNKLREMPSAEPEQLWIPCSETIDIPDHEVLCCDKYGEELIGWLSYNDDQWLCESDGEMMYDPIAWCEKPEPYKGEQDGQ